jgi:general secretion pathway protein G
MKKTYTKAFTMIELVFVIVVLGILAAIAVPKMAASRTDAEYAKGRSDIASIRSAIVSERQQRLLRGESIYISKLHTSATSYFDGNGSGKLLMYGVVPKNSDGFWKTGASCTGSSPNFVCTYTFRIEGTDVSFDYNQTNGTFDCNHSEDKCKYLTE